MNQPPYDQPQHVGSTHHPDLPWDATAAQPSAASIVLGIVAVIWAGIALIGHTVITVYLGLGAIMTHSLDGVFGDSSGGAFNLALLLTALIGQLLGLVVSVVAMVIGIGAKRKRMRRSTTALVLGIVATAVFLLIGLIQLPLGSLFFEIVQAGRRGAGSTAPLLQSNGIRAGSDFACNPVTRRARGFLRTHRRHASISALIRLTTRRSAVCQ